MGGSMGMYVGNALLAAAERAVKLKRPLVLFSAAGGARMTSGYVTAPQCVPSRAGLLTGRYQNRFGVESNGEPLEAFNAQETIAERLKKAGYATALFGKWGLGEIDSVGHPMDHGFLFAQEKLLAKAKVLWRIDNIYLVGLSICAIYSVGGWNPFLHNH